MRIACFHIPLFPLAARLRSEPELAREAVIITEGNGTAAHIVAASKKARKGGIHPGLSLPQARAILPRLIARSRDEVCERSAQDALLEVAESFSPRIEDAGEGVVYLDLDGLERHYGASSRPDPEGSAAAGDAIPLHEKNLAQEAMRRLEAAALPGRVGIGSSKLTARIAAELPGTPVIVAPGREAAFLAPLPLSRLCTELKIASVLERWGIDSIGQFARLPEGEVATRLGDIGRELHWSARGIDPRPIIPVQPPPSFDEGMDLEWPLISMEPFLFVANAALDRLATRLEARGYSCRKLDLMLRLEPDGWDTRSIELPAPTRDVKTLLTLTRLNLEEKPPNAPVAGFRFIAHPDKPRRGQLSLFGPPALSPDKLTATIARIGSIVGADRIGSPRTVDGYLPERHELANYDPPPPPRVRRSPRKGRGLLAVRVLRPPMEVDVITNALPSSPDAIPTRHLALQEIHSLVNATEENGRKQLRIEGSVRIASGPWTLEDGWWTEAATQRDYWDVELARGGLYRVYRERGSGKWYVDGVYD